MGFFNIFSKKGGEDSIKNSRDPFAKLDLPPPPIPGDKDNDFGFADFQPKNETIVLPHIIEDKKPLFSDKDEFGMTSSRADWDRVKEFNSEFDEGKEKIGNLFAGYPAEKPSFAAPAHAVTAQKDSAEDTSVAKPIFVEMERYVDFLGEIGRIQLKFRMLESSVTKIAEMREKEELEGKKWSSSFEDIRKKMLFIDDMLFESKG